MDLILFVMLSLIFLFLLFFLITYRELKQVVKIQEQDVMAVESNSELTRDLSEFDITMVGVGGMIGAGIFVLTGFAAGIAGPAIILAFLLNGLISILNSMVYAELGSAIPEAGGGYLWIRTTMGHFQGFISGWMSWFAHIVAGGLYALGFGSFAFLVLEDLFFPDGWQNISLFNGTLLITSNTAIVSISIFIILIFLFINFLGSSETGLAGNIVTLTKLVIIVIFIISGLLVFFNNPVGRIHNIDNFLPNGLGGVVTAMGLTFIAFEGYEIIVQSGEEVKNPRTSIPKAVFKAMLIVIPLYVFVAFVALVATTSPGLPTYLFLYNNGNGEYGLINAAKQFMPFGYILLLFGGLVATTSALNATTYSSSRVAYVMGRDKLLPKQFVNVNKSRHTPHVSILLSGLIMIIIISTLPIVSVAAASDLMFLLLFIQVNYSIFKMRDRYGDKLQYGYKTKWYPLAPILAMISKIILLVFLIYAEPESFFGTTIWLLVGVVVFVVLIRKNISETDFSKSLQPFFKKTEEVAMEEKQTEFFDYGYENPDEFFVSLDHILLPISGHDFELISLSVATLIAKEYNAEISLFHVGEANLTKFTSFLDINKVRHSEIIKKQGNIPSLILQELSLKGYKLLIMPSRRRKRYIDRFKFDSVSAKVIPKTKCDVLQVYASKNPPSSITTLSMDRVFLLMSYSKKDPYLLFYSNSFLSKQGEIFAYRFLPVPIITPLQKINETTIYTEVENKFTSIMDN